MAFSPQTQLTNFRYKKAKLHRKFKGLNVDKNMTDLKNVLEQHNNETQYHIYHGSLNKGDTAAAKRIFHIFMIGTLL